MSSPSSDGLSGFATDSIIILETVAVNCLVFNIAKFTIRRPRPFAYDPNRAEYTDGDDNAALSFFSGHTSLSFSMATSYSYLFTKRHPNSLMVIPVWLGTHALASATALLRVRAGKHFWTDVMVGAAVGSAIGFLVPFLHTVSDNDQDEPTSHLMVTPQIYEGGFGATATWIF